MLKLGSEIINNRFTASATFGENSWAVIRQVAQAGAIPASWAVGDTKEITGNDGNTYHIRIVDKQLGRYDYSDNSGRKSNIVLEFVELPNLSTQWSPSKPNGGFALSQLRKNLNGLEGFNTGKNFLSEIIPADLAAVLVEVNISTRSGSSSTAEITTSANKLFVPCCINVGTSDDVYYVDEDSKGQYDYYVGIAPKTSSLLRKKALVTNSTSYQYQWLASTYSGDSLSPYTVTNWGALDYFAYSSGYYVAPCFAF